jgi:hypothetical protein
MVGPSAMGSVKGIPSSIMSTSVNGLSLGSLDDQLLNVRTSATSLHPQHNIGCVLRSGISCSHICNEGRLPYYQRNPIISKYLVHTLPSFLHCANVFLIASMMRSNGGGKRWDMRSVVVDENHRRFSYTIYSNNESLASAVENCGRIGVRMSLVSTIY